MNSFLTILGLVFILLLQVLVCNSINFLGFINPYIYVALIFLFPFSNNRFLPLLIAFLYGLSVDFFSDTGGIHTFSLVFVCYIRLFFLRIFFRKTEIDFLLFRLNQQAFGKVFNYVLTLTFIHHLLMFGFANFSFSNLSDVLLNAVYSTVFTVILYFLGTFLFRRKATSF